MEQNEKYYVPEKWVKIDGYSFYFVSNYGNVKRVDSVTSHGHKRKGKVLSCNTNSKNYKSIDICENNVRQKKSIHVLVAKHFIPNPENKPFVNHKDANKHNNYVENLEWVTPKENVNHAASLGLKRNQFGEKNNMSKLNESDVVFIKKLINNGERVYSIHKKYFSHLGLQTLYSIKYGRNWSQIL